MAIEVDGRLIGEIQTYVLPNRPLDLGVYEFGIALYEPGDRGKGFGTEAVRLFVGWLFLRGARRVQGAAAVTNTPMRRVFQKLGFEEVGPVDVDGVPEILFKISRSEWESSGPVA